MGFALPRCPDPATLPAGQNVLSQGSFGRDLDAKFALVWCWSIASDVEFGRAVRTRLVPESKPSWAGSCWRFSWGAPLCSPCIGVLGRGLSLLQPALQGVARAQAAEPFTMPAKIRLGQLKDEETRISISHINATPVLDTPLLPDTS